MLIRYIYHSCYVIEIGDCVFVFDYYKGSLPKFDPEKRIYVFASHKHHDHFTMDIFKEFACYPNCNFILSNDIKLNAKYLERYGVSEEIAKRIYRIGKRAKEVFGNQGEQIEVETLTSTDEGVAFIVTYQGKVIYHAGDLNWWSWRGETEAEYRDMTNRFKEEIKKVEGRHFDVAFLVLDPRQEERYWWGFDHFMRTTETQWAIPMHCWEKYEVVDKLMENEKSEPYREKIVKFGEEGMKVEFEV